MFANYQQEGAEAHLSTIRTNRDTVDPPLINNNQLTTIKQAAFISPIIIFSLPYSSNQTPPSIEEIF